MARKTKVVRVPLEGRDQGKAFLITEMPSTQAERWATRALLAMGRSGISVPNELLGGGMAVIATYGLAALLRLHYEDAEPLLAEMMECVRYVFDDRHPETARQLILNTTNGESDDIEEVGTLLFLRSQVFELHTGFSLADVIFPEASAGPELGNQNHIPTSQTPSR